MPRVLFWSDMFPPYVGGVEVLAPHYLRGMRARDYEFAVVTRCDGEEFLEHDVFEDMHVLRLNLRAAVTGGDPRRLLQLRRAMAKWVADFAPDVLHIYHVGMGAMLFDGVSVCPRLLTFHAHPTPEQLRPKSSLATLLQSVDFVTGCSHSVIAALRACDAAWENRSCAIPNALAVPALSPAPLPFAPPRILGLGRLVEAKGFDTAIAVFARLTTRFPSLRLTIAGNGPALPSLVRQAKELALEDKIDFPGWVAPDDVPALLNEHTLTIMPSRNREPFGLVALQTAQMARPIVAADTGGLPEIVEDGVTGLLAEPDDVDAFAAAAEELLSRPERAAQMGRAARERAVAEFSWEKHLDAYDDIMQRLLVSHARNI